MSKENEYAAIVLGWMKGGKDSSCEGFKQCLFRGRGEVDRKTSDGEGNNNY